jgi:hypothetical protein
VYSEQFQPLGSAISPSPDVEVFLDKPAALSDVATGVKRMLTLMPPDVTKEFAGPYRAPSATALNSLLEAVTLRETAMEVGPEALDKSWLVDAAGNRSSLDEKAIGMEDSWNAS